MPAPAARTATSAGDARLVAAGVSSESVIVTPS